MEKESHLKPLLSSSPLHIDSFEVPFETPENAEEEGKIVKIIAFRTSFTKTLLYIVLSIFTAGFYFLLCKWYLKLKIRSTLKPVHIEKASYLLIFCLDGSFDLISLKSLSFSLEVSRASLEKTSQKEFFTFEYRLFNYYYDPMERKFLPIQFSLKGLTNYQIHEVFGRGLENDKAYQEKKSLYGMNSTEVPEKPILKILVDEILSPFYLFQIFSCILWYYDEYQIYATVILVTTVGSISLTLWDAYYNMKNLRKMSFYESDVNVFRGVHDYVDTSSKEKTAISAQIMQFKKVISSLELIPGDIIEVPENSIIPCDLILLNGNCIINECILTGESIPILKTSLPYNSLVFNPNDENKSSMLFSGTKCIETRYFLKGKVPVLALVAQTGFNTVKGQLVRSILFPKNNSFQFYKDSLKFIGAMSFIAFLGFIWSLVSLLNNDADTENIVLKCLDMITVTVPPALPTCMTVGIQFALTRLKKKNIFCISPLKINISGKVNIMCFDKTGTLTEEGLDTYGVLGIDNPLQGSFKSKANFSNLKKVIDLNEVFSKKCLKPDALETAEFTYNYKGMSSEELFLEVLSSCHSLTLVGDSLIGDPLDIKMFESTGWVYEDNNENKFDELVLAVVRPKKSELSSLKDFDLIAQNLIHNDFSHEIGIIRRFEFSSQLQRMSVIVKSLNENKFRIHIKGSPEKLRELCLEESIPADFHKLLDNYSRNGYRVLACASRPLQISFKNVHKFERDAFEKDAIFLGFLIMENKLKPQTLPIIDQLQIANIRTIMVTGDNALTAISVARQCHIVNPKQRVYLGELSEKPLNGKFKILWKDFDFNENQLNPETLKPLNLNGAKESDNENSINGGKDDNNEVSNSKEPLSHSIQINANSSSDSNRVGYNSRLNKTEILKSSNASASSSIKVSNSLTSVSELKTQKKKLKIKKFRIQSLIEEEENQPPWLFALNETYSLALTGRAFSHIIAERQEGKNQVTFQKILDKTQVFARMKPADKSFLIQCLQEGSKQSLVGMCGDGANDCGALKTADVGISLSEAEASIAAPFTSKIQNISCVVKLLREGRCALSTSFQCFKYIALYSMIQFATVVMLYDSFSNLSDNQFLWIDLILIFPLAIFMSYTKSNKTLSSYMPTANLISFPVLSSVIGQILIQFGFQVGFLGVSFYKFIFSWEFISG